MVALARTPGPSLQRDLIDVHRQQRDFLAEIVVELPRDARALDFLGCDEAACQPARIFLARLQRMLVDAQGALRAAPSRSLKQQARVSGALDQENGHRANDVALVLFPERVLAKADIASGGQLVEAGYPICEAASSRTRYGPALANGDVPRIGAAVQIRIALSASSSASVSVLNTNPPTTPRPTSGREAT